MSMVRIRLTGTDDAASSLISLLHGIEISRKR